MSEIEKIIEIGNEIEQLLLKLVVDNDLKLNGIDCQQISIAIVNMLDNKKIIKLEGIKNV